MADREYTLPVPVADEESAPFFEGARLGKLMLLRCASCGTWHTYAWHTYGIMHQRYHPAFAEVTPYNYALVELEEGPHLVTNIVDCPNEELRIDMPVEAVFDDVSDETTLVRFRPSRDEATPG